MHTLTGWVTPVAEGDTVVLWVQRRTSDQEVTGSTPTRALLVQQP